MKNNIEGKGTKAKNKVVLTNAAFALKIGDEKKSVSDAFAEAKDSVFSGKAKECLSKIIRNY